MKPFNIVLVSPEIPQNTGNIGRLAVSTGTRLHLIKPLGFTFEDKYMKRAGMDYWKHLDVTVYENWKDFTDKNIDATMYFMTTKSERSFWTCPYEEGAYLVYGNEGHGLPPEFYELYEERMYTIPMTGEFSRSLNIANSVAVTLYEGIRKNSTT